MKKWSSYADDLIFAGIDLGGGFKSAEQVGLDLAKTAATAVVSMGCSAAGSAIGNVAGKAMEGASKFANFATQAGISVATTYVSTVATSAVNNVQLGADGKLTFDKDNFGKSLYSASTIAGAVGAGFTAGLNEISVGARTEKVKNPKTGKMENQVTYTRANGLSSAQIASIQSLNGLAGGLVQNGVSLAMGGDATFNILDFADIAGMFGKEYKNGKTGAKASTGLLEVSFGQNGFKSRIGMGGTNISVNSLLNSMNGAKDWDKSEKINDYVDGKDLTPEEKKKLADALRMQYGFGNEKQLTNLDDILSDKTNLGGTDTDGKAQTVVGADGSKTIMMAMSEGMDWKELGLLIGHEAFRDGIVSDEQIQKEETREAVKGHTEMAEKMLGDVLYASSMKQLIDNNQNLQMDLLARAFGDDIFNAYVDGTYDSSADYWKLMDDGSIKYDGKTNLYDEKENLIYETSDKTKDGSLAEILYGKSEYKSHLTEVQNMMTEYFDYYVPEGKDATDSNNWYFTKESNKEKEGIDGKTVFDKYGNTIVSQAFAYHYDSTVDNKYVTEIINPQIRNEIDNIIPNAYGAQYAYEYSKIKIQDGDKYIPNSVTDRFNSLYSAKKEFYESAGSLFESDDLRISGPYGDYIRDNNGNLLTNYKTSDGKTLTWKDFYKSYGNLHYGIDIVRDSGSDNILLGLSGKVIDNVNDPAEGYTVRVNYGYNFEDNFISTGIYGEYGHLKNKSNMKVGNTYNANDKVGLFGNTGDKSTGAHLHYSIYTKNSYYSDSTMRILLGNKYKNGSMYNGSWRTVYNPTRLYEKY